MNTKNIAVIGGDGLVGSRFIELSSYTTHNLDITRGCDITNPSSIQKACDPIAPSAVINFAAYTDVNSAEKQRGDKNGIAWKVNVNGAQNVAHYCNINDIPLIHISTDFVFRGTAADPGPYLVDKHKPRDPKSISWYGWTKKKAEDIIQLSHAHSAIVRISYPFRASFPEKTDFLRIILDLHDKGDLYPMFSDQFITPTYIDELAEVLDILLTSFKTGIYHVASSNTCTPHEFAQYALEHYTGSSINVKKGSIVDFLKNTNTAHRPQFGGLSVKETELALGINFRTWQKAVTHCLDNM